MKRWLKQWLGIAKIEQDLTATVQATVNLQEYITQWRFGRLPVAPEPTVAGPPRRPPPVRAKTWREFLSQVESDAAAEQETSNADGR